MSLKVVISMLTLGYNVPPSLPPTTSWTVLVSTLYSNPATVTCPSSSILCTTCLLTAQLCSIHSIIPLYIILSFCSIIPFYRSIILSCCILRAKFWPAGQAARVWRPGGLVRSARQGWRPRGKSPSWQREQIRD